MTTLFHEFIHVLENEQDPPTDTRRFLEIEERIKEIEEILQDPPPGTDVDALKTERQDLVVESAALGPKVAAEKLDGECRAYKAVRANHDIFSDDEVGSTLWSGWMGVEIVNAYQALKGIWDRNKEVLDDEAKRRFCACIREMISYIDGDTHDDEDGDNKLKDMMDPEQPGGGPHPPTDYDNLKALEREVCAGQ
jgi:hypothetical protein